MHGFDSQMSRQIDILKRETVHDGFFRINRYRLRHELSRGGMSPEIVREVFERGHAVGVLPYDPVRDEVVLLRQFRIGAHVAGFAEPWLTEIVAGIIDDGETPEQVAIRETREETGLSLGPLIPICRYLVSPGGASESVRLFAGRVDSGMAGGVHGEPEEMEDIETFALPATQAIALLEGDHIGNAITIIALQWLALNRDRVRAEWTGSVPGSGA